MKGIYRAALWPISVVLLPIILLSAIVSRIMGKNSTLRLFWGCDPILNNKYWAKALSGDYYSKTYMKTFYSKINKKEDFDFYSGEYLPNIFLPLFPFVSFVNSLYKFDVFHISFNGCFLGVTPLKYFEAFFLKLAGKKIIVIAYGSDSYTYRNVRDVSMQHAMQSSYPEAARKMPTIEKQVTYWVKNADIVLNGIMAVDGFGRWDILAPSFVHIDTDEWKAKETYSTANGENGAVKILHTPNHRGCKGTEYLMAAVDQLRAEGLNVELLLLEGVQNEEVKRQMQEADILAEQFIMIGHGLSGVEGMASGLPVMANLSNESYTRVFRRFSFLNECPILSTTPENITNNLRVLVKYPDLREQLGRCGRAYAEKYHSFETARFVFSSIYEKLFNHKNIDLLNLFHPLKSGYQNSREPIQTPLSDNSLPDKYN